MLNIIPIPKDFKEYDGFYCFDDEISVKSDFDLPLIKDKVKFCDDADIVISADNSIPDEGYSLVASENGINISASERIGAYYALISLFKATIQKDGKKCVPCCEINDEPKFKWRGINIDESRHFFGMDIIKEMLDYMFLEKLNVFHWHLTDDQGWRIEIKKYPPLTEKGSKRAYTHIGGWNSFKIDKTPHEGFYTQQEIKEIVEYARERGIMVVPEIDFPAHCAAAIAQYKHLACREIESQVPGYFGGIIPQWKEFNWRWNRTVCCGKESTFEFIFGVLDEVCELFDAPYLHMGGDEAPKNEWKKCPECQRIIRENGLSDEVELQGWFENRILDYLKDKGKQLIAWNEVLEADNLKKSDNSVVIQYWTPKRDDRAEAYVNGGGNAILSNHQYFYFDMTYAQIPLDKTYSYRPEYFGMTNTENVLGYEGELWSEWIADREKLQLQAFPRLQALGEVAWSSDDKIDFENFKKRLDNYKNLMDNWKINYAVDSISLPKSKWLKRRIMRKFTKGNPYLETELNREYKSKGER